MKKLVLFLISLLTIQILIVAGPQGNRSYYYAMIEDENLSPTKRLALIDSLMVDNKADLELLLKKWDLLVESPYSTTMGEVLADLYNNKFDSLDISRKCKLLSDYGGYLLDIKFS